MKWSKADKETMQTMAGKILDGHAENYDIYSLAELVLRG